MTTQNDLLRGLNPAQCEAVEHKDGPLLVLAGPGSGKTRVVTHRIARLMQRGVSPRDIIAVTFTNKAADEMKRRLETLAPDRFVWMGTFHKFCSRLLRAHADYASLDSRFTIYDMDDSLKVLKSLVDKSSLRTGVTAEKVQTAISAAKNAMVLPDDYVARPGNNVGAAVAAYYGPYQDELRRLNAVDFDDLLLLTAVVLRQQPHLRASLDLHHRYLLVDEYQDTNTVQYEILKLLSRDHPNLAVTGDPDQSIYGWRGANIGNILSFDKDFPKARTIKLEQNYRSTPEILRVAGHLIRRNTQRKDKDLITSNASGVRVRLRLYEDQQVEAVAISQEIADEIATKRCSPRDVAILYRMNALSRNFEHALRSAKVPFRLVRGVEFYARAEVKDVLAYLDLLVNPSDDIALARVVNSPPRGIGKTTMQKAVDLARQRQINTLDALGDLHKQTRLTSKTAQAIRIFGGIIEELSDFAASQTSVEKIIRRVLDRTGYLAMYTSDSENKSDEDDNDRAANVEELITVAREFDSEEQEPDETRAPLERFLERTALVSDVDVLDEKNCVSLMTFHAAKGLEFPVVYIVAVEEGILPHSRSIYRLEEIEEERRLLFVGMTRAERALRLSYVARRSFRGQFSGAIASSFLFELPREAMDIDAFADDDEEDVVDDFDNFDGIDDEYDDDGKIIAPKRSRRK